MDDECECDDGDFEPWVRQFRGGDLFVLAFSLVTDVTEAVQRNLETATRLIAGHVNWQNDRADFHEQAALEIETLTKDQ